MNFDPDGEIDLGVFALDAIKWLHDNNQELFRDVSKAVLEDADKNFVRTGKAFNSFDLLREIIEKTEKKQQESMVKKYGEFKPLEFHKVDYEKN